MINPHSSLLVPHSSSAREDFLGSYRRLRRASPDTFGGIRYRELKQRLRAAPAEEVARWVGTALCIVDEMGVSGATVTACLLMASAPARGGAEGDERGDLELFGRDVGRILAGMERVIELYRKTPVVKTENFRNLALSFAQDVRVILIMIADRANILRKTAGDPSLALLESTRKTAEEAAYLYAPLAHKLGLYVVKGELEDLSLKVLNRDAYYHIKEKLGETKQARDAYIAEFIKPVDEALRAAGLRFRIRGRTKSIHSIWQKMMKQRCGFEGVYDLFAIRIILDSAQKNEIKDCWNVYGILTDMYQPNPKRLRDWLSVPKSNGYESLHITVLGPGQKWVEVQIRTERMDDIAEHGLAAHWRYKEAQRSTRYEVRGTRGSAQTKTVTSGDGAGLRGVDDWLETIREALEAGDDNLSIMDSLTGQLRSDEIYVFTPRGDLIKLPQGATVLDFAYNIHSRVGDHCVGAQINNRNASIKQVLRSGDQVNVVTQASQTPKREWLNVVKTGRARAKIKQSLREQELKEAQLAREQIERTFKNRKLNLEGNLLHQAIVRLGFKEEMLFFKALSERRTDIEQLIEAYQYIEKLRAGQLEPVEVHTAAEFEVPRQGTAAGSGGSDVLVIENRLKGVDYQFARCCQPVPGDAVFGFVSREKGIKIHRMDCPNARELRERFPYRVIEARWAGEGAGGGATLPVTLRIVGKDDLGVVNNISSIVSKEERINMRSFNIDTHDGLFAGSLTLLISDLKALERLMKKLRTVKGVSQVSRN